MNKFTKNNKLAWGLAFFLSASVVVLFQNCGQPGSIVSTPNGKLSICEGVSCTLDPLTDKPAVTTILLALGDEANQQLVVNGASAQLIAETVIRYTSPKNSPKILVVRDRKFNGEDPEDTLYVADVLLKRYSVVYMEEPVNGLTAQDVQGYDVIWFNNPGHAMSSVVSRDTLMAFAGAVVIQGDDLTQGTGFSMKELTGLEFRDNGSTISCGGVNYNTDDNAGEQFVVSLNAQKFPQSQDSTFEFRYGNDIDDSVVVNNKLEVLATAKGSPASCTESRPAIVRYEK